MKPQPWFSVWPEGGMPSTCELCGAEPYGFLFAPTARVCKDCFRLTAVQACDRLLARGISPQSRIPSFPDE